MLGDIPSVGHPNAPPNGRAVEVNISLKPGATVHVTAADGDGNTLEGRILIRLEALDGRLFIPPGQHPHLSTFASSVWSAHAKTGAFSFTELDAGEYSLDVMQFGESQIGYRGGHSPVVVGMGETKSVEIEPADHQTKVTIKIPRSPSDLEISPFLLVSRNPGLLLWYDGKAHSLEDPRLGRLVYEALFFVPVQSGSVQTVGNLPPGTYSVFAGAPICMAGVKMAVAHGDDLAIDIPRVEPDGPAEVNLWRLKRRVKSEARAYTAQELCELLTANNDHRVRFKADPSIQRESVELGSESMSMWDLLEKLYVEKGWRLEEEGKQCLVLLPESMAKKPNETHHARPFGGAFSCPTDGRPPVALLYHEDAQVRIEAVYMLAMTGDRSLVDDLVRAKSVEFYTPVHNAYRKGLRSMTGGRTPPEGINWKAWLAGEVEAGNLKIDYLPIDLDVLDPEDRKKIQPFATRLGPEHFEEMAAGLVPAEGAEVNYESLRYMVANDHLPQVQEFLRSDWLAGLFARPSVSINTVGYEVNALANPSPLRDRINARVRECLDSDNPTVVANALHLLAGKEGFLAVFAVPNVESKVRELVDNPVAAVAHQARRAMGKISPSWIAAHVSYEEAFVDLYEMLGREYPSFDLKGIDWKAVGEELLPRAKQAETDEEFGLVCLELVARLEDSHAHLQKGTLDPPWPPVPRWDPGLACFIDDRQMPVVYYLDKGGPAETAGIQVGTTVLSINGKPAGEAIEECMQKTAKYTGYSSRRYLRYQAARWFVRQMEQDTTVALETEGPDGERRTVQLPATLGVRYLPRLPLPVPGVSDSANVSWTTLDGNVGYIYVRRIGGDLIEKLDAAVGELKDARGLVVDVRGNSGGGFDAGRSHRNFALDDGEEPERPRFKGPMALVIDARCISAGEGWASWFIAKRRARVFGETTAGASSRKRTYTLKNGFYRVTFPVKAYRGSLDRPIERRGLEPDVPLRQNAQHLAAGRDTVLEAAKRYLLEAR